ncbi:pseudouridine-5'-phosphate glycosidase [Aurantimonas sp. MSK8Z-1]|uniref:pseudouridine-5'-phosphate glycosidase n=1 Tax=Mangrovibrevibacter kandeliae TaxID=2968473 RepID=UPI00211869C6|nr:pseudouridine-5'-phosphate glycosidase [Aurantimonas sp. MSK8Z-1]MCW4114415.1 pseudouridine-5'-phosphate glycosidase [Aurantimonas sp. MSK8Z-1]
MTAELPFRMNAEVAAARAAGRPVVALESTIITHGMPWPDNLRMARRVEAIVREAGAVPATIAVLDGRVTIGLEAGELEALAQAKDVLKLSRADLAYAVATGRTGATTVAATMIAAARAGIAVFATGGIGGVHRGAAESFDVSADLKEFARSAVIVVAAGAKAILDLKKTLEVLETEGVPVVGFRTTEFPSFWCRSSGLPAPLRLDTAAEVAAFQRARQALGLAGGMLVANPVPPEHALDPATVGAWIEQALRDADAAGIAAKAVTPFLLGRIFELSGGRSLKTNIALVEHNASVAAGIAVALTCATRPAPT